MQSLRPPPEGADFFQEWASARNVLHGLPAYTPHEVTIPLYTGVRLDPDQGLYIRWNAHPPTSVLLALPFALLSYSDATLAWNFASLVALAVSLVMLVRGLSIRVAWWVLFPPSVILLLSTPFRQQMIQAQLNPILLLLITGAWGAARSERPRLTGVLLAAAAAIKVYPGFLFLLFLLRRRYATVVAGAMAFVAIAALTAAALGGDSYRDYVTKVLPELRHFRNMWANASIIGFWFKLFEDGAWHYHQQVKPLVRFPTLAAVATVLSWATIFALWVREVLRVKTARDFDLAFGLSLITMLILSPITWDHYFLLLFMPLAQLWLTLPMTDAGKALRLAVLIALCNSQALLWKVFLTGELFHNGSVAAPVQLVTLLSYQCYLLVALFFLARSSFRIGRRLP